MTSPKQIRKVREVIKKYYLNKKDGQECYITGLQKNLEVHHLLPIKSVIEGKGGIKEEEEITITLIQDKFPELLSQDNLVILTQNEHKLLHEIFGRTYDISKVPKVKSWIENRRSKLYGKYEKKV